MYRERGLKGNCPYKRKKDGVCEVSIPNARRDEGARLGRGQQSGKRGVKEGFLPSHDLPTPNPIHPTSPIPPESYVQRNTEKIVELAGRREVEGDWGGGRMKGWPSPVLPPPGGQSHGRGPPNTPPPTQVPPSLGERDMAFPRVSSLLPLGVETKKGGAGGCVYQGRADQLVCPPQHTHPPKP